jgi:hypothetical protein
MSAVILLASGAQAASGTSTPVDVSAFTQLRQTIAVATNPGQAPEIDVWIEMGPTSSGPFTPVTTRRYAYGSPGDSASAPPSDGKYICNLAPLDLFARVRWSARATRNSGDGSLTVFMLSVTGTGLP